MFMNARPARHRAVKSVTKNVTSPNSDVCYTDWIGIQCNKSFYVHLKCQFHWNYAFGCLGHKLKFNRITSALVDIYPKFELNAWWIFVEKLLPIEIQSSNQVSEVFPVKRFVFSIEVHCDWMNCKQLKGFDGKNSRNKAFKCLSDSITNVNKTHQPKQTAAESNRSKNRIRSCIPMTYKSGGFGWIGLAAFFVAFIFHSPFHPRIFLCSVKNVLLSLLLKKKSVDLLCLCIYLYGRQ